MVRVLLVHQTELRIGPVFRMDRCSVCESPIRGQQELGALVGYECPRCGQCAVPGPVPATLRELEAFLGPLSNTRGRHRRSRLSHILRRQQRDNGSYAAISMDRLQDWRLDDPLPSPIEQADSIILWVGDRQPSVGETVRIEPDQLAAWIGDTITTMARNCGVSWLLTRKETEQFIAGVQGGDLRVARANGTGIARISIRTT
jgi:hypothetical protein